MGDENDAQEVELTNHVCEKITVWAHAHRELEKPHCTITADTDGYRYYALTCYRDGNLVQYRARGMTEMKQSVQSKSGLIYRLNDNDTPIEILPKMSSGIDISTHLAEQKQEADAAKKRAIREITEALSEVGIVTLISDDGEDEAG